MHADDGLDDGERRRVDALAAKELGQCGGALVVELVEFVPHLGTFERSGGVDFGGQVAELLEGEEGFSQVLLGD